VDSIYPEAVENPPWLLIGSGFQHSPVCASVTLELLCLKIRNLAEEYISSPARATSSYLAISHLRNIDQLSYGTRQLTET
jgi:hypothetical protein